MRASLMPAPAGSGESTMQSKRPLAVFCGRRQVPPARLDRPVRAQNRVGRQRVDERAHAGRAVAALRITRLRPDGGARQVLRDRDRSEPRRGNAGASRSRGTPSGTRRACRPSHRCRRRGAAATSARAAGSSRASRRPRSSPCRCCSGFPPPGRPIRDRAGQARGPRCKPCGIGSRSRPSEKPLFIDAVPALQNGLAVESRSAISRAGPVFVSVVNGGDRDQPDDRLEGVGRARQVVAAVRVPELHALRRRRRAERCPNDRRPGREQHAADRVGAVDARRVADAVARSPRRLVKQIAVPSAFSSPAL